MYIMSTVNRRSSVTASSTSKKRVGSLGLKMGAIFILSIASWNLRGLASPETTANQKLKCDRLLKREQLVLDCERYGFDIVGLQETKCTNAEHLYFSNKFGLLIFEQKEQYHGGVGFVISARIREFITAAVRVSDRVCYLDLSLPLKGGGFMKFRVINCYGYTTLRAAENPRKVEKFYEQISAVAKVPSKWELYVIGDMNSKLGKRSRDDELNGLSGYIGSHGIGTRNSNGEYLINFMASTEMTACNTMFQHSSRHKTTWTGQKCVDHRTKRTIPLYAQLDYILCKRRSVVMLDDCRSYGGATLCSDHKPVVARISLKNHVLLHRKKFSSNIKYNCSTLHTDPVLRHAYQDAISNTIKSKVYPENPNDKIQEMFSDIKSCAEKVLGVTPVNKRANYSSDPTIAELVTEKQHKNLLLNSGVALDRKETRKDVRNIQKSIRNRLIDIDNLKADALADTITSTDSTRRMFEANRALAGISNSNTITVHDKNGNELFTDAQKAETTKKFLVVLKSS